MTSSPVPLWIDNEPVPTDVVFRVTNNATKTSISAYGATEVTVKQAITSSHRAFQSWKQTTHWQRRDLLQSAAQLLRDRKDEAARILRVEMPIDDTVVHGINIATSIDLLDELAAHADQTTGTSQLLPSKLDPSASALVVREPMGVQLGIAPWNASLLLGLRAVATPIACGNTAVLKASELSPLAHNFIGLLFRDAGFPPGVLNIVQHRREDGPAVLDALVADPRVRKVNFTGSTAVGKIVASKAAEACKPVLLELGGKAPMIVLRDADLDKAAEAAAFGAFLQHGQICMSTERIIVHEEVFHAFSKKLGRIASKFETCAAVTLQQASKVFSLVQGAVDQGAQYLYGEGIEQDGSRARPQILTKVTRDMEIWHTETFGPVALLVPFDTLDEAVKLANDCSYGLSASIFSADVPGAVELARRLESRAVHVNSTTIHDEAHFPHGGTKSSGWGRFGVPWGFAEFTQLKTITVTPHT